MIKIPKKLSLLDTLLSLPVDPAGMMYHLLRERRFPPYLLLAPTATLAVLVGPSVWYMNKMQLHSGLSDTYPAVALTTALTMLTFSFFLSVLMRLLLLNVSMFKVLVSVLYSCAGLIPFMLAFYLGNYLASGHLSVLKFLATGRMDSRDWFVALFPISAKVALGFSFFLFTNAIRALTDSKLMSAFSLAVLAIPVLIGSFAVALTMTDIVYKDTGVEVYRFFTDLLQTRA